jgi:Fe-S cluster assembly iron-binding protein IscA
VSTSPDEKGKFDELVTGPGGVKILVDNKALMHVVGTRMDFVNDRLKCVCAPFSRPFVARPGPHPAHSPHLYPRSEFVFQNPNSKGACGCGESFTT